MKVYILVSTINFFIPNNRSTRMNKKLRKEKLKWFCQMAKPWSSDGLQSTSTWLSWWMSWELRWVWFVVCTYTLLWTHCITKAKSKECVVTWTLNEPTNSKHQNWPLSPTQNCSHWLGSVLLAHALKTVSLQHSHKTTNNYILFFNYSVLLKYEMFFKTFLAKKTKSNIFDFSQKPALLTYIISSFLRMSIDTSHSISQVWMCSYHRIANMHGQVYANCNRPSCWSPNGMSRWCENLPRFQHSNPL